MKWWARRAGSTSGTRCRIDMGLRPVRRLRGDGGGDEARQRPPVFADPLKGVAFCWKTFLIVQNVTLDIDRFKGASHARIDQISP
jgi:hypothetical protein